MASRGMSVLLSGAVAIALSAALAAPVRAADDTNPEIANCEELKDEATVEQANTCKLHVFCGMVFRIQKACTKAKAFLGKLKNLSLRKERLDGSDVFDAAAPSTDGDTSFNRISAAIKSKYDGQPKKEILTGQDRAGGKDVKWVYEGPVKDGKREGTGVLVNERGEVFRGDFTQGRQSGAGDQFFEDGLGQRWAGQMTDQLLDGQGVMRFPDGGRYEGEFRSSKWEGKGSYVTPGGIRMEGDWKAGRMNGRGVMIAENGNRYEGDFVNGVRHGHGTLTFPNGDRFVGAWVDGKQHGPGTYRWADGDRFEGEYRDGKRYSGTTFRTDGTRAYYVNGAPSAVPPASAALPAPAARRDPPAAPAPRRDPPAVSVGGEVCQTERQGVISAQAGGANKDQGRYSDRDLSLAGAIEAVEAEMIDGGDFRYLGGADECGPRCKPFQKRGTVVRGAPNFREGVLLFADLQDLRVARRIGRGPLDFAYYRYRGCVARYIAATLK